MQELSEPTTDNTTDNSRPTGQLFLVMLQNRIVFLKWAFIGAVISSIVALLTHARYDSQAQLMPPDQNNSGMLVGLAMDRMQSMGIPPDLLGAKTSGALFVKIMRSETVTNALVDKFDLRKAYATRYRESARKILASHTTLAEDRKSGVITIRVRDTDPQRAQAVCRAYIDELTRLSTQLSTTAARREREFLEQRLAIVKREVYESEAKLGEFSSKNSTVDISQQSKAMVEATATLQGRLIAAESELAGLKKIYGDQNGRVRSLQGNVDELRRNLRELSGTETGVTATSGLPSLRRLPILGVTYVDLLRQAKISEAVLEALTKQYELAKVQEAKDVPSVRMLDEPNLPERKSFPPRTLIAVLGAILGAACAGVRVLWGQLQPEDPKRKLAEGVYLTFLGDFQNLSKRVRQLST